MKRHKAPVKVMNKKLIAYMFVLVLVLLRQDYYYVNILVEPVSSHYIFYIKSRLVSKNVLK